MYTDINDIIERYQALILDIWGVLHNGNALLPGVKEFIAELERNKEYYLLSNSPRPASVVCAKLKELGLDIAPQRVMTSGAFFLEALKNPSLIKGVPSRSKAALIGLSKNRDLLDGVDIDVASTYAEAGYAIILAFGADEEERDGYIEDLREALKYDLPMMCANPDKTVYHGDKLVWCQGYFASVYEDMGGKVHYFGKPYMEIYEYLFKLHGIEKSSAIMIGDSLATDIAGANNFGIDSALVLSGMHKDEIDVANLLKMHTNKPTYILRGLDGRDEAKAHGGGYA